MIQSELLIEEFLFTCASCAHVWRDQYDVRHVEDGHGHECDYFFRNHHPSADPTAPYAVACPTCGSTRVHAKLISQRGAPPVQPDTSGEATRRG